MLLICVEDELHKCHKNDFVKLYVKWKGGGRKVTAIEPKEEVSSTPGVGWSNFVVDKDNLETFHDKLRGLSKMRRGKMIVNG